MIQIVSALIVGIFVALGIVLGMICTVAFLITKSQKSSGYKADELVEPFQKYLKQTEENEWYEQRPEVLGIIRELREGVVPDEVENYKIKKDVAIHTTSNGDGNIFRIEKTYIVQERKLIADDNKPSSTNQ